MPQRPQCLSPLDLVRMRQGPEACRTAFHDIYARDRRRAVMLLNDRRLTFPCLYILSDHIEPSLHPYLRERLAAGLRLIGRARGEAAESDGEMGGGPDREALRWILDTGCREDGLDDTYEEVLERCVSVLINTCHDTGILPRVADMIFARHRAGRNIHDLTWAYFQSGSPDALRLIARRLDSTDPADAALACSLLHIDTPENGGCGTERQPYLKWLRENDPYLYFTGESMQYASAPDFCRVDLGRKYLRKGSASYDRKPVAPADERERALMEAFTALPEEDQTLLAEHSHRFYARDPAAWRRWMARPIGEQIRTAKVEGDEKQ